MTDCLKNTHQMDRSIKSIVFDLDGVLIDSRLSMNVSWDMVKAKYSLEQTFDDYVSHIGVPFSEIMKEIGVNDDVLNIKDDYFKYTQESFNLIKPYDGSREVFSLLKSKGISTGIITSKEKKNTQSICSKFGFFPDEIITPNDVKKGKPSLDSGAEYLSRTGFSATDVLYVGDMESDYIFSKNVGFGFVYADYGYGSVSNSNCDAISEILDIINFI